ncbi:hypothetical protein CRG98_040217, partial [Punica granatum]
RSFHSVTIPFEIGDLVWSVRVERSLISVETCSCGRTRDRTLGRLADFGLAGLYDHGTDPQSTQVMGTLGYLAREHTRTGKATMATDVFSSGAFLLEMATGRRPIEPSRTEDMILVDWVFYCWSRG